MSNIKVLHIPPEVVAMIRQIDALKAELQARPVPPEPVLQRLEREFFEDAVKHEMSLSAFLRKYGRD